jgi:hypothetical protein
LLAFERVRLDLPKGEDNAMTESLSPDQVIPADKIRFFRTKGEGFVVTG